MPRWDHGQLRSVLDGAINNRPSCILPACNIPEINLTQQHAQAALSPRDWLCRVPRRQAADPSDSVLLGMTSEASVRWGQGKVVESPFASVADDLTPHVSLATTQESWSGLDEAGVTVLPSSPVCSSALITGAPELPDSPCHPAIHTANRGCDDITHMTRSYASAKQLFCHRSVAASAWRRVIVPASRQRPRLLRR